MTDLPRARFEVNMDPHTALWVQDFMDRYHCSGTEALRWMASLAKAVQVIRDDPREQLAVVRKKSGWKKGDIEVADITITDPHERTDRPTVDPHPSGLRVIKGGKS